MILSRASFSPPALLLALLATLLLSACGPVERAPLANAERAAALALRGEHAAAATEYELLAAGSTGVDANTWRLSAIEQWLRADRVDSASNALAALAPPLETAQSLERDRLSIELVWRRDGAARAWQAMTSLTAPDATTQPVARDRFLELRQRLALANALPVDAVSSALEREAAAGDSAALAALRATLLSDLRATVESGLRIDPRLAGRNTIVRGWLEAASLAARAARVPASGNAAITASWNRRYPNHPARTALAATHLETAPVVTPQRSVATPTPSTTPSAQTAVRDESAHIAVLLPLSGRLAAMVRDVRDGLIAAQLVHGEGALPLRFYDTAAASDAAGMQALIDRVTAAGARLLLGPLGRDEVALAVEQPSALPRLLLNTFPPNAISVATAAATNASANGVAIWQYALSPEEEAKLAAQNALANNQRRAIMLLPTGDWAARVGAAFRASFEAGGGRVLAQESLDGDSAVAIERAMRLDQSRARHRRLQSIVNETLVFQPRRRGDVDLLFTPGAAAQLRQLRGQLKFNGAADIPTYATADAWDGTRSGELEGLLFADMPWMIAPPTGETLRLSTQLEDAGDDPRRRGRLFAFGYDAWLLQSAMLQRLAAADADTPLRIEGVTGVLSVSPTGIVQRELQLARISAGVATATPP